MGCFCNCFFDGLFHHIDYIFSFLAFNHSCRRLLRIFPLLLLLSIQMCILCRHIVCVRSTLSQPCRCGTSKYLPVSAFRAFEDCCLRSWCRGKTALCRPVFNHFESILFAFWAYHHYSSSSTNPLLWYISWASWAVSATIGENTEVPSPL